MDMSVATLLTLAIIAYSLCCDATGLHVDVSPEDPMYHLIGRLQDPQHVETWIIRQNPSLGPCDGSQHVFEDHYSRFHTLTQDQRAHVKQIGKACPYNGASNSEDIWEPLSVWKQTDRNCYIILYHIRDTATKTAWAIGCEGKMLPW